MPFVPRGACGPILCKIMQKYDRGTSRESQDLLYLKWAFSGIKASTRLTEQHLVKEGDGVSKPKVPRHLLQVLLR